MTDVGKYLCIHCGEEYDTSSARAYDMRCVHCEGMIQENPNWSKRDKSPW